MAKIFGSIPPIKMVVEIVFIKNFNFFKKLTVILLVFLFILTPLAQAAAAEATTDAAPTVTSDITVPSGEPSDNAAVSIGEDNSENSAVTSDNQSESSGSEQVDSSKQKNPDNNPTPQTITTSEQPDPRIDSGSHPSLLPHADEVSGALISEYSLTIPPGRNGFQPDLKLQYNSQNSNEVDSLFGAGWSLNIPYIERVNKKGVQSLYSDNYFNSSLSGELVAVSTTTYISRTDYGEFLNYHFEDNYWIATDKKGYTYYFGTPSEGDSIMMSRSAFIDPPYSEASPSDDDNLLATSTASSTLESIIANTTPDTIVPNEPASTPLATTTIPSQEIIIPEVPATPTTTASTTPSTESTSSPVSQKSGSNKFSFFGAYHTVTDGISRAFNFVIGQFTPKTALAAPEELYSTSLFSDSNLKAYYRLEDVNDSKNSYHLTNINSTPFNAAKFNNGADFGSGNTNKALQTNTDIGIDTTQNGIYSFHTWINYYSSPTNGDGGKFGITGFSPASNKPAHFWYYYNDNGTYKIQFVAYNGSTGSVQYISFPSAISTGTWHTLDLIKNGATISVYLDGGYVNSATYSLSDSSSVPYTIRFGIGKDGPGGNAPALAIYDDTAVFNRALSGSELYNLYYGGSMGSGVSPSRQDDPNDGTRVYKWMLDRVVDPNGNEVNYTYYKSNGQIYPETVTYAGESTSTPLFEIDFLRELRGDVSTTTKLGFQVVTASRINEVNIKINGNWARKYALAYSTGGNGRKSLLGSITESGRDDSGNTTTLPAMIFSYQGAEGGWASMPGFIPPTPLNYAIVADVNGDGYSDIMYAATDGSQTSTKNTFLNDGQGNFATSTPYEPPVDFYAYGSDCQNSWCDKGIRMADVNGDGLVDMFNNTGSAYINTGSSWTASSTWASPLPFANGSTNVGNQLLADIGDINGDGLPDVFKIWNDDISSYTSLYLNNGNGFTSTAGWSVAPGNEPKGRVNADLNGDGLTDLIRGFGNLYGNYRNAYINNSSSTWSSYGNFNPPLNFQSEWEDLGVRVFDFNGDGLPDINRSYDDGSQMVTNTYLNTGNGWTDVGGGPVAFAHATNPNYNGTKLGDMDGNGRDDAIFTRDVNGSYTYGGSSNTQKRVDLLKKITYPQGGSASIVYKPAVQYKDGSNNLLNPNLSLSLDTVYQIVGNEGTATSSLETFTYKGGKYYYNGPFDRKFAGFSEIDKTDAAGNLTKTFYHQADISASSTGEYLDNYFKISKPYLIEQYDSSNNLYSKTINKWDSATSSLNSAAGFVKLAQTVKFDYDGSASHKDKAETYTYNNSTGDITQKVEYGEVTGSNDGTFSDTGADDFTTTFTYATSSTSTLISLPSVQLTVDHNSNKVKEFKLYYDNLGFGSVDKGNLTKREDWKSGGSYIDTEKTYNSFGLPTSEKDPRDKSTTYAYDANNLYPITVTNPASHIVRYTYDYSSGKTIQTTDPNGNNFQNIYDGLDRLTEQKQPDPAATSTLVSKLTLAYTDTANSVSVHKTNYLSATTSVDSYTYLDGLGRKKQERTEAEGSNFIAKDYIYNNIGLLQKESLPYFSVGSSTTTATSTAALFLNYYYDPLQRLATTTNVVGTSTAVVVNWKTTLTDQRGKIKDLYIDTFGNLVRVDEHSGTSTFTTLYTYNYLKNLVSVTDALNNVRNFTYDGLGRRLTAEDLHASGDGTYGSYVYTYDDSGNLTQKVDPNSQTVNYTYDDINRPLTEDYTGSSGTEVMYTYDTCTQGKGQLCTASSSAVTIVNIYDALGRVTNSTSTTSSVVHPASYSYDRQGNQIGITNPDSSQVKYIYNSAGLLEQIQRKESTDSGFGDVISNFDYSPEDKITAQTYANGVTTTNTYDEANLYRLSRKVTTQSAAIVPIELYSTSLYNDANLIAYYRLENINDSKGSHHLTNINSTPFSAAKFSNGADFGAGNPNKALQTNTDVGVGTQQADDYTFHTWINYYSSPTNGDGGKFGITGFSPASNKPAHFWYYYNDNGTYKIQFVAYNGYDGSVPFINLPGQISTSTWHSLDLVKDGGTLSVYLDGGLATSTTYSLSDSSNVPYTVRFGIGKDGPGGNAPAPAIYDDTAVFTRALTATEISNLYTGNWPHDPGTAIQDLAYTYDANGNITKIEDVSSVHTAKVMDYSYDDLNRLTSASSTLASFGSNYRQTYSYDAIGNITNKSDQGAYTYSGTGYTNPHAVTSIASTNYGYDSNGNMTSAGNQAYSWDYNNRLTQVVIPGSPTTTVTALYDPSGQRVKYTVASSSSVSTYYPTKYYNTNGTTPTKHIFAGDMLVATVVGTGASSTVYSIITDHLSGTNLALNASGTVAELMDYYPYGTKRLSEGTDVSQREYIGEYFDEDSGLSYLNARYLNSNNAKFISQDPVVVVNPEKFLDDPQQMNYYSYGRNNPITNSDPTGLYNIKTGEIERGDTLSRITGMINSTNSTNYTVSQIAILNGINNPNKIYPGQFLIPNNSVPDITRALNTVNRADATVASSRAVVGGNNSISTPSHLGGVDILGFANNFKEGGDWDLKSQPGVFCQRSSCGGQYAENYVFNGQKIPGDAPGNIHYGYVGSAVGYPLGFLHFAGGMVQNATNAATDVSQAARGQMPSRAFPTWDPIVDRYYITWGYNIYGR